MYTGKKEESDEFCAPANMSRRPNAGLLLDQRRRWGPNSKPTLG